MGLKDLTSQLDLVGGTDPVGNMNAQQGPQFQLPIPDASQVHVDSLQDVPGFSSNSPFQDLDGVPDPNFNTLNGTSDSPFNSRNGTGDHMVDLLTQNSISTNSGQTYNPSPHSDTPFQDLDGLPGPQFDLGQDSTLQTDSLFSVPGPPSNSPFQDLDGEVGPAFDLGPDSTLKTDLLENIYQSSVNPGASYGAGQPGGTWPSIIAGTFDLNGGLPASGEYISNMPD